MTEPGDVSLAETPPVRQPLLTREQETQFVEFWLATFNEVSRKASRFATGDREWAGEAVNEAYVRAIERWAEISTYSTERQTGWMVRTVGYILLEYARKRGTQRRGGHLVILDDRHMTIPANGSVEELVEWRQRFALVCQIADEILTKAQLDVFFLFVAGYTDKAIANMLGIDRSTVTGHRCKAREELKRDSRAAEAVEALRDGRRR